MQVFLKSSIDEKIDILLNIGLPIIAWDWDGTLSMNGVNIIEPLKPIIRELNDRYSLGSIIVTGRSECPPITFEDLARMGKPFMIIWNEDNINSYRFKFYVLRKLLSKGNGVLRLYIDNDYDIIDTFRKRDETIPVSDIRNNTLKRVLDNITIHKKMMVRINRNEIQNENS